MSQLGTLFQPKKIHESYRNNLAKKLKSLKVKGNVGKDLASALLDQEKDSSSYISANILREYGYGKIGAMKLIESNQWNFLAKNIEKFEGLDAE